MLLNLCSESPTARTLNEGSLDVGYLIYELANFSLRSGLGFVNYFNLVFIGSIILFYQNKSAFKHRS